jgi:hypothetical protein
MRTQIELAASMIEAECRHKFEGLTKAEDLLRVAFKAAFDHWMFTDEQDQFKGAVGAVLITLKEGEEFERLQKAVKALGRVSALINALQAGIPVDFDSMEKPAEDEPPVIPLNQLWCEVKWPKKEATG